MGLKRKIIVNYAIFIRGTEIFPLFCSTILILRTKIKIRKQYNNTILVNIINEKTSERLFNGNILESTLNGLLGESFKHYLESV